MRLNMPVDMKVNEDETNLSLAGCGYLGIYHVGVASCLRMFAPHILTKNKISGASVGALVAAAFACDVPLELCTNKIFDVSMRVRCGILGPITPDLHIMKILYDNMAIMLPEDAHLRCNGRLFISVTRYDDCQNVLLSQFDSKTDLLQALMCSCFIPLYCGYEPPEFHGVAYVDGGYSDNSPYLNEHTVIVAPFAGDSGICPRDKNEKPDFKNFIMNNTSIYITLKNCRRLFRILFPGPPDMLKDLCQKGFNDGLLFLRDRGFVDCPNCIPEINGNQINSMKHINCKFKEYPLPLAMCNEIDKEVEKLNQSLSYRLLQNPLVKVLYYVNIPSIFTVKMTSALLSQVTRKLQNKASSCVDNVLKGDLLQIISQMLQQTSLKTKFQCHIDLVGGLSKENVSVKMAECQSNGNIQCHKDIEEDYLLERNNEFSGSDTSNDNLFHSRNNSAGHDNDFLSPSEIFRFPPKSSIDVSFPSDIFSRYNLSKLSQNHLNEDDDKNTNTNTFVF